MLRRPIVLLIVILVLLALATSAYCAGPVLRSKGALMSPVAGKLRTPGLLLSLNKSVKLQGFFYDGSIPMILDDINRVNMDMIIPPEAYVPLVGPKPTGLKWGDKIEATGILRKPTSADPANVRSAGLVLTLQSAQSIKRVSATKRLISPSIIAQLGNIVVVPFTAKKYAVLIAGGWNPANSHIRYWNDLKAMRNILLASGYQAANIYVIYADGAPRGPGMPVNFSATKAHIATVFGILAGKMTANDTLYIMTNDHGSRGVPDTNGDETEDDIDEELCLWGQNMTDDEFAVQVNRIQNYKKMIIQMKQCFSGGYVADLTKPKRIVMSSSLYNQVSYSNASATYGEFTYWYMSALARKRVDTGAAIPGNPDTNGDGKISICEAWNYARARDAAPETPQYEDNGVKPCHGGNMPAGGEGALGMATWL